MPPKKTAVKDDQDQHVADEAASKGEVAIFQPPRLPYHEAVEERFGVDKGQWKVLVEAIFPAAKSVDAIVMALSYCKSRNLDVMKRPVHIVPMWDSARGGYVETVWPGISELRTTASRTKGYAGVDEADFGPVRKVKFTGRIKVQGNWKDETVEVEFPDWCRLTVYRIVDGQRCKFVGPKVKWEETYATTGNSDIPNKMWQERPEGQLEKCAEAAALRRAFPEELGNELTAEEMTGRNLHELITATEAAAEPAGAPASAPPQPSAQPGQRDAAPPRRAPAAVSTETKPDPITTGPIKTDAPPRSVTAPSQNKEPEPAKTAAEETKPHKIPGKDHSYASWAAKYCDLVKTSADLPAVYSWIKENQDPLTRLEKGAPTEFQKCRKAAELLIDQFRKRAEQEQKAKDAAKAKPQEMDAVDAHAGEMDDEGNSDEPEWPTNPEEQLALIDRILSNATADNIEAVWQDMIEPNLAGMFPPDAQEAQGLLRKHEKRLG